MNDINIGELYRGMKERLGNETNFVSVVSANEMLFAVRNLYV